ncbi:ribosome recycling factor [Thermoclostridium stercorarium subsp. leptospartum DSM 9219]|uniref:Ribosome-recycling factor n=1 Tax=Thermoclostridium stercorarium subsp. leptospartum DSM 9219 TaxID=1346611 RepID=A0A1B1YKE8_THEST|nr:ribosome recycling factor [Thermoclostridium stercorarium]ANX01241.1 ribosome recycling factor [Thermoclostridium stercorarium subsp. leptospartum DSM 9219]
MQNEYKHITEKMDKTVAILKEELVNIRAGRANPRILDKVKVEYYGVPTPINQLANINVPEARQIVIQPWDPKILSEIEKAIIASNLGLNPNNDGKVIRLIFPPLTEERRVELTKQVKKVGENAKVAIRQVRRDALEQYKKMKKNAEITEDDLKEIEEDIQKITDNYIEDIDKLLEAKIKEIMEV